MRTIYKYELEPTQIGTLMKPINMPHNAHYLHVGVQGDKIFIWVEVDTDEDIMVEHTFEVFGTGHEMYENMGVYREYVGTVMMCDDALVFHVYSRND